MESSVRHRQLSEADLRTLETLEPDSSSQGSSGAMSAVERLEAAMSLSTLSAGLIEGGAGYQFHEVEHHQHHEQQAVGVLVIMSPDHVQHSISLEDSGARSLDSSMESESSRQLVEGDAGSSESQPQLDEEDTRTSTGATAAATSVGGSSPSSSSPSRQQQPQAGETSNGSQAQSSSSQQQQQQRSQQSSTTGRERGSHTTIECRIKACALTLGEFASYFSATQSFFHWSTVTF